MVLHRRDFPDRHVKSTAHYLQCSCLHHIWEVSRSPIATRRVVDCEERTASWLDEGRSLEPGEYEEGGSRNESNGIEAK